ncbi:hypothetical protein CXG81DRAFT_28836, partial [Caulochytrium protostelioides]
MASAAEGPSSPARAAGAPAATDAPQRSPPPSALRLYALPDALCERLRRTTAVLATSRLTVASADDDDPGDDDSDSSDRRSDDGDGDAEPTDGVVRRPGVPAHGVLACSTCGPLPRDGDGDGDGDAAAATARLRQHYRSDWHRYNIQHRDRPAVAFDAFVAATAATASADGAVLSSIDGSASDADSASEPPSEPEPASTSGTPQTAHAGASGSAVASVAATAATRVPPPASAAALRWSDSESDGEDGPVPRSRRPHAAPTTLGARRSTAGPPAAAAAPAATTAAATASDEASEAAELATLLEATKRQALVAALPGSQLPLVYYAVPPLPGSADAPANARASANAAPAAAAAATDAVYGFAVYKPLLATARPDGRFRHRDDVLKGFHQLLDDATRPPTRPSATGDPDSGGPVWTLLMLSSGHFAGLVVDPSNGRALVSKTFHRYTTRKKQGGAQSANDNAKGAAHSAGATLRRYGEQALQDDVATLLRQWRGYLDRSRLIFLRAPRSQRKTYFFQSTAAAPASLQPDDPRLRAFPFPTNRPTLSHLKQCCERLWTPVLVDRPTWDAAAAAAAGACARAEQAWRRQRCARAAAATHGSRRALGAAAADADADAPTLSETLAWLPRPQRHPAVLRLAKLCRRRETTPAEFAAALPVAWAAMTRELGDALASAEDAEAEADAEARARRRDLVARWGAFTAEAQQQLLRAPLGLRHGQTFLHLAAKAGNAPLVDWLLNVADVDPAATGADARDAIVAVHRRAKKAYELVADAVHPSRARADTAAAADAADADAAAAADADDATDSEADDVDRARVAQSAPWAVKRVFEAYRAAHPTRFASGRAWLQATGIPLPETAAAAAERRAQRRAARAAAA